MSAKPFRVAVLDDFERIADTVLTYGQLKTRADIALFRERLDTSEKIIAALRESSGEQLDLPSGTVYPALRRLEERGFVQSHWKEPAAGEGGMPRKYYRLTDRGRAALSAAVTVWRGMTAGACGAGRSRGYGSGGGPAGPAVDPWRRSGWSGLVPRRSVLMERPYTSSNPGKLTKSVEVSHPLVWVRT